MEVRPKWTEHSGEEQGGGMGDAWPGVAVLVILGGSGSKVGQLLHCETSPSS